jgi:hypothetical protein
MRRRLSFAYPCIGQKPVSVFDYIWILHPFFQMSSRKYFKFCPYFIGISDNFCGKVLRLPVENSVEKTVSVFDLTFNFFGKLIVLFRGLCKTSKMSVKIFFLPEQPA